MNDMIIPKNKYVDSSTEDEIDLFEIFKILWNGKWLIILISFMFTIISIGSALIQEKEYLAEISFICQEEGSSKSSMLGSLGGFASMAGFDIGSGSSSKDYYLAILKSRFFLKTFIDDNNLLPVLFEDQWDVEKKQWALKTDEEPPSLYKGCKFFKSNVFTVSENKENGLISLKISFKDPIIAANWANLIIDKVNLYIREKKINEYNLKIKYLKEQIDQTSVVNMQKIFYKLIEQQIQNKSLAEVKKDFAFQVVDPAVVPELPYKPNRKLIVVLGCFAGGFFGVFLVFILNFFSQARERLQENS